MARAVTGLTERNLAAGIEALHRLRVAFVVDQTMDRKEVARMTDAIDVLSEGLATLIRVKAGTVTK